MTKEQQNELLEQIKKLGFERTFTAFSWDYIEDKIFQGLLNNYNKSSKFLEAYIQNPFEEYEINKMFIDSQVFYSQSSICKCGSHKFILNEKRDKICFNCGQIIL